MYTDKLDDIVNEYNNAYHRKIKMIPVDVKKNPHILTLIEKFTIKIVILKLMIM